MAAEEDVAHFAAAALRNTIVVILLADDMASAGLLAVSLLLSAAALGSGPARADVYVWVDAAGTTNVSNLAPPDDARVTRVIHSVPRTAAQEEAARDAARRAELQALNDRVARLQEDLEQQRREAAWVPAAFAPPPVVYAPPPYVSYAPPPPPTYVADVAPPYVGCDYGWNNCGLGWGWPYAPTVIVGGGGGGGGGKHFRRGGPVHTARPVAPPRWVGPVPPLGGTPRG